MSTEQLAELAEVARVLVAPGKGILAADESTGTMTKRLDSIGVESTPETRRRYRGSLFATRGIEDVYSGVILFDETIRQRDDEHVRFVDVLKNRGIHPGIKVDTGANLLALHPGEKVTEGLDGLRERLTEYHNMGARFAKWRAVITLGPGLPTLGCLEANAHALARYAALCQEVGLVPIIEPEVDADGEHSIDACAEATRWALQIQYEQLHRQEVYLPGTLLKPSVVSSGHQSGVLDDPVEVAERTLEVYRDTVPASVPGVVLLSGGHSDKRIDSFLNLMNQMGPHPWEISFSYGRAAQRTALQVFGRRGATREEFEEAFLRRALDIRDARQGVRVSLPRQN